MMDVWKTVEDKLVELRKYHSGKRPLVVAIDGLSGSGKTTLCNKLKRELDGLDSLLVIHIDNHITRKENRYGTGQEEWYEYYQLQWDTHLLTEELFKKLRQGEKMLSLPYYNFGDDTYRYRTIDLSFKTLVVIEGIFLLREEWQGFYDHIFFLDCPKEIRYARTLKRDAYIGDMEQRLEKYRKRYWIAEEYYLRKQRPMELADTILTEPDWKKNEHKESQDH